MSWPPRKRPYPWSSPLVSNRPSRELDRITDTRLLSYDCLKSVLAYLDANRRFEVYKRLPAVRQTEQLVPLKLDFLTFNEMKMTVNDTSYQLGIIREFHEGHAPTKEIECQNSLGGVWYDLDKYGFEDTAVESLNTFGLHRMPMNRPTLERNAAMIKELEEQKEELIASKEYDWDWRTPERKERELASINDRLLPLICQRRDEHPPYDSFIQMTVAKRGQGSKVLSTKKVPYNMKLYDAFQCLIYTFLGRRNHSLIVNRLKAWHFSPPVIFQMKISELRIDLDVARTLQELTPMIDTSSPLVLMKLSGFLIVEDLQDPIYQYVGKIEITDHFDQFNQLIPILPKNVHFTEGHRISIDSFLLLIQHWQEGTKDIGTCLAAKFLSSNAPLTMIQELKDILEIEPQRQGPRSFLIKINSAIEIKVTFEAEDPDYESDDQGFLLRFRVVPVKF